MMDRRGFLLALGGLAIGGGALARRARGAPAPNLGERAAPAATKGAGGRVVLPLADLAAGDKLTGGITITGVRAVERGAIPVDMITAKGRLVRVEVLARDTSGASPAPVAETASLALYVVNGGHGDRATPAEVAEATRALATLLSQKEAGGHSLPALPTFARRAK
jgi:hypothetical protein